jgi:hypothetical protein
MPRASFQHGTGAENGVIHESADTEKNIIKINTFPVDKKLSTFVESL